MWPIKYYVSVVRTNRNRICVINDPGVLEKKYNNYLFISTTVNNKKTGFFLSELKSRKWKKKDWSVMCGRHDLNTENDLNLCRKLELCDMSRDWTSVIAFVIIKRLLELKYDFNQNKVVELNLMTLTLHRIGNSKKSKLNHNYREECDCHLHIVYQTRNDFISDM